VVILFVPFAKVVVDEVLLLSGDALDLLSRLLEEGEEEERLLLLLLLLVVSFFSSKSQPSLSFITLPGETSFNLVSNCL